MKTESIPFSRRQFIATALAGAAGVAVGGTPEEKAWHAGRVHHLLPTVSHDRLLLKASFDRPLRGAPKLRAGNRAATGVRTDTAGEFYSFDITGLEPERTYQLSLLDSSGKHLCDPWPIATFPLPLDRPKRFRLMVYTCAGG